MSVDQLKELVKLAKSKGLTDKEFDKLYLDCDKDPLRVKSLLEEIGGNYGK